MNSFREFYLEAIDLEVAKEKKMSRKYSGAYKDDAINSVFNGKDRLIYPYDVNYKEDFIRTMKNPESPYAQVANFLESLGYPRPSMKEYIDGLLTDGKQQMKIGKILNKNADKQPDLPINDSGKMAPKFSHLFKIDPVRHIKNSNLAVVVSRHPYDIYGMSTDRMWTSCMDLDNARSEGNNCRFIPSEIEKGTLIAYLIPQDEVSDNGKAAIRKPVSRILLKPLRNEEGELGYAISQTYGGSMDGFEDFVEQWSDDNFNSKVQNPEGFSLDPDVYDDPYNVSKLGLADNTVVERRKIENELRKLKEDLVSHIPRELKPHTQVNYFVDEDDQHYPNAATSTVSFIFKDPEFIKNSGLPQKPIRIPADTVSNYKKIRDRYNIHWKIPEMESFKGISVNPNLGIVKFVFSNVDTGWTVEDVREMYVDILKIPAQTLKLVES